MTDLSLIYFCVRHESLEIYRMLFYSRHLAAWQRFARSWESKNMNDSKYNSKPEFHEVL